jgi:hypothetical protein
LTPGRKRGAGLARDERAGPSSAASANTPSTSAALADMRPGAGRVAEWFKAAVLKTAVGGSPPWVRIPPRPPLPYDLSLL